MDWTDLFERADTYDADEAAVREALAAVRERGDDAGGSDDGPADADRREGRDGRE
ncbi:hypothetical protein NGM10_12885 [Halorussus salilacus]|uniref:hypothetical protein n=1 Tax=Halorussus salilacus TaxID=2953750 RepID=UPI00209FEE20|nr:hypothetical protein [Halorussus salilacus]USZ67619.1 hypothetical protein NGM10_12885 [Halorussus salilacus]